MIEIFEENKEDKKLLESFLAARRRLKERPTMLAREVFRKYLLPMRKILSRLESFYTEKARCADLDVYRKTKKLSLIQNNKEL